MAGEFQLTDAVPWGRSEQEYRLFFALDELPAGSPILDCAAGPSSFAAERAASGRPVIAADPLYAGSAEEIWARIDGAAAAMAAGLERARERFVWDFSPSIEAHMRHRLRTARRWREDFCATTNSSRYIAGALPHLPFADGAFGVALCSHFLFLYDERWGEAFHHRAVREMLRVAGDVRVFPLLDLHGRPSEMVSPVMAALRKQGYALELRRIPYEFQKGGHTMLRIARSA